MRLPVPWLADHVELPPAATAEQLADILVGLGFETEEIHTVPATVGDLVVGRVLTIEELTEFKKPIRFCTVDVGPGHGPNGSDEPRGIICGARNFTEGDLVVVALPGTELPGGFQIASRQTYGRLSDGMICSVREMGLGTEHEGILVLAHDADPDLTVGMDARPVIGADDAVIELAITADRGYALSIRGLAREMAVALDKPFRDVDFADAVPDRAEPGWPVTIADPGGCSRFVTVRVAGVDPAAPSPYWMRKRLQQAGVRSISLAVDVTNYVMLEYGQPLHAFDSSRLTGQITVRRATGGETLTTLDGQQRALAPGDSGDLVVADESGAVSLAGVMGGESTEISASTTEVLIEAANWDTSSIYRTAKRHKLPSEASRRFERGVDPAIASAAAEKAAALLVEFGGGRILGRSDVGRPATPGVIRLPLGETERLVGRPFDASVIENRLRQLGCRVDADGKGDFSVTPPSWRSDLTRAADLTEEVARLESYDTIPSILPTAPAGTGLTGRQRRQRAVAAELAAAGLIETLSFPFVGEKEFDDLALPAADVRRSAVRLINPLDATKPLLTTTLLPGLLDTVVRNISRGGRDLDLYEIGQVFIPRPNAPRPPVLPVDHRPDDVALAVADASLPLQPRHVAGVLTGNIERAGWWGPGRAATWADAIELARRVGVACGIDLQVSAAELMPWHPGRCARLSVGGWPVGHAGELHPVVCERWGLPARTVAFELDVDTLPDAPLPVGRSVSAFPPVHVDLAVVVPAEVSASAVAAAIRSGAGDLLESARLFDVYTGDQVSAGHKSLAFALTVRAADRTLTAAEAVAVRDAALAEAHQRMGAVLR